MAREEALDTGLLQALPSVKSAMSTYIPGCHVDDSFCDQPEGRLARSPTLQWYGPWAAPETSTDEAVAPKPIPPRAIENTQQSVSR